MKIQTIYAGRDFWAERVLLPAAKMLNFAIETNFHRFFVEVTPRQDSRPSDNEK